MHDDSLDDWRHTHTFGQDLKRPGERRTFVVIAITAAMMVVELAAGWLFGSMALLADGLHMASHAAALSINAFAYVYARRHARDARFSFGTGKVNALGGFSGAVLLILFAALMAAGSVQRLAAPVEIDFDQAILVAVAGLIVNGICALILGVRGHDGERGHRHDGGAHAGSHAHADSHAHIGEHAHSGEHARSADPGREHAHHHHDHNLRSAYLHVMADALTSLLAIVALLTAKYLGYVWMDPVMGLVGAALVTRWSLGLLRVTAGVLLDHEGPAPVRAAITAAVESDGDSRVAGLHVWSIGPGIFAADVTVVAHDPAAADDYKARLPAGLGLAHVSIETHAAATDGTV